MVQPIRTPAQLGAEIRRQRKSRNLSQTELGLRVKKRQGTISTLESKGSGTLDTLFAALSVLGLELIVRPRTRGEIKRLEDVF